jgi:hypothetical protein
LTELAQDRVQWRNLLLAAFKNWNPGKVGVEKEGSEGNGPKMGRSAIEEEEFYEL